MRRLNSTVLLGCAALFASLFGRGTAAAQAPISSDLAAVMLSASDVPGFRLLGEASPPDADTPARIERTRFFVSDGAPEPAAPVLLLTLSAPRSNDACTTSFSDAIATGAVLSSLNGGKPAFELYPPLGIGDHDAAASWAELGSHGDGWSQYFGDVFMRGDVSVYLTYHGPAGSVDVEQMAAYAREQDSKLLAAVATPSSAVGRLASAAPSAADSTACQELDRPHRPVYEADP